MGTLLFYIFLNNLFLFIKKQNFIIMQTVRTYSSTKLGSIIPHITFGRKGGSVYEVKNSNKRIYFWGEIR